MSWILPTARILEGLTGTVRTISDPSTGPDIRTRSERERQARRDRYQANLEQERAAARRRMAAIYERRRTA